MYLRSRITNVFFLQMSLTCLTVSFMTPRPEGWGSISDEVNAELVVLFDLSIQIKEGMTILRFLTTSF